MVRRIKKRYGKRVKRVSKFSTIIKRLQKLKPSQRQQAIEIANDKFIRDFAAHVKKLRTAKSLKPGLQKKLKKHCVALRKLTNKKTTIKMKRKLLSQRGGLLPLALAMSIL